MSKKIDYYNILLDLIPIRKSFKSYSGTEGIAYFVSDEYVLKEYTRSSNWADFDEFFDAYCLEIQSFANSGMNVANIYSWLKMPNLDYYSKGAKNKNSYFILEERIKGRELYFGYLEDAYMLVSDLCDRVEFKNAIRHDAGSLNLYEEIIRRYICDYIQMNEYLESFSDDELLKFFDNVCSMYKNGVVCSPDLYPHNIIVDSNSPIKLIDLHLKNKAERNNNENIDSEFIRDLVGVFAYNCFANKPSNYLLNRDFDYSKFSDLSKKNIKVSRQVITRFFTLLGSVCNNHNINNNDKEIIHRILSLVFDAELSDIEKSLI